MLSEVLLLGAVVYLAWKLIGSWSANKNLPPGPIRIPIIGNLLQLAMNKKNAPYEIFQDMCRTYGPIMYIQLGSAYQVVLEDYQHIKEVLTNEVWVERYYNEWFSQRSFGKILGVLIISGDTWKEMRRFTIRTLRDFGFGKKTSMEMTIQDELHDLTESLVKTIDGGDNIVSMKQFFTISVLNILWSMMAGFRFSHNDKKLQELLVLIDKELKNSAIGNVSGAMYLNAAFPYLAPLFNAYFAKENVERHILTDKLHQFFRDILEERRAAGDYKEEQRDYIDVFLREIEANKHEPIETNLYTDEQFIVVSMDLFMAGSETTSNTIEYAILFMILHPEIQAKVQAEIDMVVGNSRLPSIADKASLPYTEATLLEVQRRANILPLIVRSPAQATNIGKYHIPKDTVGVINLYGMHMNETVWKNPFEFQPDRFLDDQNNVINADKILPFGIGRRMCLGEVLAKTSLFTFFTTMLQRFSFEISPFHGIPTTEPDIGFTLSPQPFFTKVTERQMTIK